jgi:hypothetical protein
MAPPKNSLSFSVRAGEIADGAHLAAGVQDRVRAQPAREGAAQPIRGLCRYIRVATVMRIIFCAMSCFLRCPSSFDCRRAR